MKILVFSLFLFYYKTAELLCKIEFLNSYAINGIKKVQYEPMLLCPEVKFKCCSVFDELVFHKNWFNYYLPKLDIIEERYTKKFSELVPLLDFFKSMEFEVHEFRVKPLQLQKTKDIIQNLKNIQLDTELRPVLNEIPKIISFEKEYKKKFICSLCDYSNHEYFNNKNKLVSIKESHCHILINKYGKFLQIRAKLLNTLLLLAHQFMNSFNVDYHNEIRSDLVVRVHESIDLIFKCFPDDHAGFDIELCGDICNYYSLTSLDPMFYGDFEFYDYMIEKYEKFKNYLLEPVTMSGDEEEVEEVDEIPEERRRIVIKKTHRNRRRILYPKKKKFITKMKRVSKFLSKYQNYIKKEERKEKKKHLEHIYNQRKNKYRKKLSKIKKMEKRK